MSEKTAHRLTGPREGVWMMRRIAELIEQHPEIKMPIVSLSAYGGDSVRFYAYGSWSGGLDWRATNEERAAAKLLEIERYFDTVTEFFDDLDWAANDPSGEDAIDANYFALRALCAGVVFEIITRRSDVGEEVQDLETGPEVSEIGGGYMQAVTTKVTTWKPNIRLKALATEGYALPAAGQLTAIEA